MALWILWYLRCYDVMRLSAASHRRGWKETLSSFSSLPPRMRMPSSGFPPRVKPLKGRKSTGIPRGPTTEIKHTNQSASTTSEGLLAPPFPVPSTAQHRSSEPSPPNHLPFPPSRQLVAFLAYQREMIGSRLLGSVALGGGKGNLWKVSPLCPALEKSWANFDHSTPSKRNTSQKRLDDPFYNR